jgi:thiol-disulfide isomerase/thioredoxin
MKILVPVILALVAVSAGAADQKAVRASLIPERDRKPAPDFALKDASSRTISLKQYRGKVVLLDVWATWCGGCKAEMPIFEQFERTYGGEHFAVIGVSLDDKGWTAVRPFLAARNIPYRIVVGGDELSRRYGINAMPDTFLIDQRGRLAATYVGVVDKDNIEANVRALLAPGGAVH